MNNKEFDNPEFDEAENKELDDELTDISDPFDPTAIDIQSAQTTLDTIVKRLSYDEIDLNPDFQRESNLWTNQFMSRLIESLLIRFPLPAFYFDASDDSRWQVVDGLQRLSTIKKFIIDKKMKLSKLEFLKEYEGCTYGDLPRPMQRRIEEAQITMYLIKPGTPSNVKFSLFYRINTGGLQLKPQEIRHALSQTVNSGQASRFLKEITETELFKEVGRVSSKRMLDRELILRYVSFKLTDYKEYKPPMITFLNTTMDKLGTLNSEKLRELSDDIIKAFELAKIIFDEDAFRKSLIENGKMKVINRALFEAVSVIFSKIPNNKIDVFIKNKALFLDDFKDLLRDSEFYNSITYSTTETGNVTSRFESINNIVTKYL